MPPSELDAFRLRLLQDSHRLEGLADVADPAALAAQIVALGASEGVRFEASDVLAAIRAGRAAPLAWPEGPKTPLPGRWIPHRVHWGPDGPFLDWGRLGPEPFDEPFFDQTTGKRLAAPLSRLLAFRTGPEALAAPRPAVPLAGLIFHMSRCGSTLVSNLLATLPDALVYSEPDLLDGILGAGPADAVPEARRLEWLRGAVRALGQAGARGERRMFLKLDCWHTPHLPLVARAFPDVPWIFVYRDGVEVLVSHARQRGRQVVPGQLPPEWLGLPESAQAAPHDLDGHAARVLGRICRAAVAHAGLGRGRLMRFEALPAAVWETLDGHFALGLSDAERERMREAAGANAKRPEQRFEADSAEKREAASASLRDLAEAWIRPHTDALDRLRAAQPLLSLRSDR